MPWKTSALLSMGSVEYQRGRPDRGWELFGRLLDLPENTQDLVEIVDKAGGFLMDLEDYDHGLEHYRRAAARFPQAAVLHQGLGYCAARLGRHGEAIAASRAAVALEPGSQEFVNDLGWCLFEAGEIDEARSWLERAVAMDPQDERAANNLGACNGDLALGDLGDLGDLEDLEDLEDTEDLEDMATGDV